MTTRPDSHERNAMSGSRERLVTLTLPHGQMCTLLGALNWARKALRNMPAGLRVPLDTLDEFDAIYREFQPAFDRAALSVSTDPRSGAPDDDLSGYPCIDHGIVGCGDCEHR